MEKEVKKSILKTLIYADLFDYPLKEDELWRFLINTKKVSRKKINQLLSQKHPKIKIKDGYYHLIGRGKSVDERKRREKESFKKLQIAKKITSHIARIPTIYLIGISGNLALRNSRKNDDIDLFLIAKSGTLWTTRFLVIIFLKMLGYHRDKFSNNVRDKICVNMFLDEKALCLPRHNQDIYAAHEVIQMMPLFDRKDMYKRFIVTNRWVKRFLPNSLDTLDMKILRYQYIKGRSEKNIFFALLEFVAKSFQLWYMKDYRSTEIASDAMLAFHPNDYRKSILFSYKQRIKEYV